MIQIASTDKKVPHPYHVLNYLIFINFKEAQ